MILGSKTKSIRSNLLIKNSQKKFFFCNEIFLDIANYKFLFTKS